MKKTPPWPVFAVLCLALTVGGPPALRAADLSANYQWRPVRLGAGGFVTGFVTHPLNAGVRYCRTDVGNAYRWDGSQWVPMIVRNADGTGLPAAVASGPAQIGVESVAVDPQDPRVVYLSLTTYHSNDVAAVYPNVVGNVFKSTDGGRSFAAGNLSVPLAPGSAYRAGGERLAVDPRNGAVLFYGTSYNGLYRSADGGVNWSPVTGGGAPAGDANVLGVRFSPAGGTATLGGQTVSALVYAVVAGGPVGGSADGGATWTDLAAGQGLDGHGYYPVVGPEGALYVTQAGTPNLWRYLDGAWTQTRVGLPGGNLNGVAVDPLRPARLYAVGEGGSLARSLDGGASWTALGDYTFANALGWLPQPIPGYRANAGAVFDRDGKLWSPQGNEGVLSMLPNDTETAANPPRWTIESQGIEEFVTHDVTIPPGGRPLVAVEDATGLLVPDPARFTARQFALQDQLISNGTGLAYCPDAPSYVAAATADVNRTRSGANYSGFSTDGGATWQRFGSYPFNPESGATLGEAGSLAVSRRNGAASDRLVWLPTGNYPPYYSRDGGATWTRSGSFEVNEYGQMRYARGYFNFSLKQRQLRADPFVPDRFYLSLTENTFHVSTDGGATWQPQAGAGLPYGTYHGQLETNPAVPGDLWFADGWEGSYRGAHGVYHSTDGGQTFQHLAAFDYAVTLCLGRGRGRPGDAAYTAYVYGKLAGDPDWGIFRSVDAGASWDRVSGFPAGLFDQPTCMAASWDVFSQVIVGLGGNSFVVGNAGGSVSGIQPLGNGRVLLRGQGTPGTVLTIQAAPNLDPNSYVAIGTAAVDAAGAFTFEDAGAGGLPRRFYLARNP